MVESLGKNLSQARQKRGLTVDEAAYATKLRPDKIVALENDDYSSFASNVYAKGFLQIYGRFLKVDVSELADSLAGTNPISVEDYQYLSNGMPAVKEDRSSYADAGERRGPSLAPILGFVAMVIVCGFGFQVYVNWNRVNGEPVKKAAVSAAPPAQSIAGSPVAPAAAPAASPAPAPLVPPVASVSTAPSLPRSANAPVLRAEVVAPMAAADRAFVANPAAAPATAGAAPAGSVEAASTPPVPSNEVLVQPLKKTWVEVRKNTASSAPIFEDYLYPDSPPLKVKGGSRLFIKAVDPSAVVIRKNGAPIAYQGTGATVEIQ